MAIMELNVFSRDGQGKSAVNKIRAKGLSPAVFYGPKAEAVNLTFSPMELKKLLRGHSWGATLFQLKSENKSVNGKTVRLKEWALHPVSRNWLHVDLMEVDLTKKMEVKVPIHFVGKAKGLTEGGVLQPIHREVLLLVKPTNIPEFVEVDVSELTEHNPLHFKDVKLPADCELASKPEDTIVTIVTVTEEVAATPVAAATAEGAAAAPAEGAAAAPGAAAGAAPAADAKGAAPAKGTAPAKGAAPAAPAKKDK